MNLLQEAQNYVTKSPDIIDRIRGFYGLSNTSPQITNSIFKRMYPEKYQNLQDSFIRPFASRISELYTAKDWPKLDILNKGFNEAMSRGEGRFGMSMGTRLAMNVNFSVAKTNAKLAGKAIGGLNSVSKATLGASLGQIGLAAGVVAGLGYMAGSAMGISSEQAIGTVRSINQSFKDSARPQYGSSQLGQSTQGLVHSLHNRRRG